MTPRCTECDTGHTASAWGMASISSRTRSAAALNSDPSHVEFVIDHPLQEGSVIVWEVHGCPVAVASRTPEVAGMVRMGLAFQPTEGTTYANAAFVMGCTEAARTAEHVLVLSGSPGSTAAYRSLGFEPVLERVVLEVLGGSGPVG